MSIKPVAQRLAVSAWLALLIALGVTIDRVVDLAFEEPTDAAASSDHPVSETPDNAAEHVLLPSPNGQNLGTMALLPNPSVNLAASLAAPQVALVTVHRSAAPQQYRPPRSSPVSFLRPLRI